MQREVMVLDASKKNITSAFNLVDMACSSSEYQKEYNARKYVKA